MNRSRRRSLLGLLALLPVVAAVFWLTAVATSGLPETAVFAINVHGLTLNYPTSTLRPAPLSLSVLDDAQLDAAAATSSATPAPVSTVVAGPAATRRPTPAPTHRASPTASPAPTASAVPLPSPSVPGPTPTPTVAPGTIAGQVIDSQTRSPIAGAAVSMNPPAAIGLTDSNGNFALIVAPGSYTVTVTAAGYNTASQPVSVKSGQRQTLSFKLTSSTATGSVAGNVSDGLTGSPIAGAIVTVSNGLTTVSDLNGNYSFPAVLSGSYTVTVSAIGYISQSQVISVKPGHQTTQNFQLAQ